VRRMTSLPTGTVTFLFTDIEESTRLLQELGDRYEDVETQHARILRQAIADGGGTVVRTEGDSFFAVFPKPTGALEAVIRAQRALAEEAWPHGEPVRVRMGMHTGEGRTGGSGSSGDYIGIDVNRAARIAAAGQGGQVLLSETTRSLVEAAVPEGVTIRELGEHRLKDLEHPQHLYDLVIEGLPADFPPIRTLAVPSNLPQERTSFVGRGKEIEEVTGLIDQNRLVTLTGPGGTGKTRLALKVAATRMGRHRDGVFLVDLSSLTDPGLVPSAIAAALRVAEQTGRDLVDTLTDHVRHRELLLVLDNFEQVAEARTIVTRLLDQAPGLAMLATSRVPLHVSNEQEYHVSPLALPDHRDDLEALSRCESVMLFAERAAAVRPSFRLSEENAAAVSEITSRLDGLPLAIELAASRLKVLDPASMLGRMEQRLPLLIGGARDLPERQRTLRAAIEWSHSLLGPEEQRLFAALSVFVGGWTLEAAEAVCGPNLEADVLGGVEALVDASLLRRRDLPDEGVRFRMLETISEFARDRLARSGEETAIRGRHAEYFRDLAEEAEPHLHGQQQAPWLARLEREHDNIRSALEWAADSGDVESGLRTVAAIWRFWEHRWHLAEGRTRAEALLALPGAERRDAVRARALAALGSVAYWQEDYGPMRAAYEEATDIAREVGNPRLLAHALFNLSFAPMVEMNLDGQEELLRESLVLAKGVDPILTAEIENSLGYLEVFRGNPTGGIESIERGLATFRELGDPFLVAENLAALAGISILTGDTDTAKERIRGAVRLLAEPISMMFPTMLVPLALAENLDGRHRRAAMLLGASARLREEMGGGPPSFLVLPSLGDPEADAKHALGEEGYERARAEGYAMSLEEAVALALEEPA
jgi:predicted ATPase/class 3 adenylate cyclase